MDKILIRELLKRAGIWLKNRLWERLKEAVLRAWESVKESLWREIEIEVKACARELIIDAETFLKSAEAEQKEKIIVDVLMTKIELPVVLRPFKGIIKKILRSKIHDTVRALLEKGKEFIG